MTSTNGPGCSKSTADAPRLAVIIPCFNYERYVGRAIESVLSQARDNVDVLVIDDGSTDDSWKVIQSYGLARTYRVPNGGPLKACLVAAQHTDADFILVLDADDELKPGCLDRIMPRLTSGVAKLQFTLSLIGPEGEIFGDPAPQLRDFAERQPLIDEVCATGSYTSPPTSGNVFRRDVFDLLRDVDYERYVDGVTLFAAPFLGLVVSLSEQLGSYRLHGSNASGVGVKPNADKMRAEVGRFVARLNHLRHVLDDRGLVHALPAAENTFFYRERGLYIAIAEGRRPTASQALATLLALARHPMPFRRKSAIAVLILGSLTLPPNRAAPLLAYRMSPGDRSASGLLRTLIGG